MIRRWLALMYYLYALRLAALSHFYFNPLYLLVLYGIRLIGSTLDIAGLRDADLSLMRHNALLNSI